jgi:hypothetical protein
MALAEKPRARSKVWAEEIAAARRRAGLVLPAGLEDRIGPLRSLVAQWALAEDCTRAAVVVSSRQATGGPGRSRRARQQSTARRRPGPAANDATPRADDLEAGD